MVEDAAGAPPVAAEPDAGADDAKLRKKQAKLHARSIRPLDPWERYRALVDTLGEA